ncbi:MAG: hypothetical protein JETT_2997 [Candidatus Jettenia ecosi]|uniref:Uncharacterized protein n=1 Tax=Candidatus Jettenia ecosi TaxID=2494326 RepID=A0A533Q7W3_9BACT|nr:MAG: hypothetical protein JETT_2997 [Candidatus Jettenia ecosi]
MIFKDVTKIFPVKTFGKEKGMLRSDALEMLATRRWDHKR